MSQATGTAFYMAPEQARGERVDPRADLYSFGCLLHELLTGAPPFLGSLGSVLMQHASAEPEPPSAYATGVPPELDALVMRLLSKEPGRRPGYADDVAEELVRLGAADDPGWSSPPPRSYLHRPGLSGRAELLGRLASRGGGVVILAGESGVGKTRLAVEAAAVAEREGALVLLGGCDATSRRPLSGLLGPLGRLADECRHRGAAFTDEILGRRGTVLSPLVTALRGLPGQDAYPDPPELPGDEGRDRLLMDLGATLRSLARRRATVVLVDDVQWADELTLDVLRHLAAQLEGEPCRLTVMATYRTDEPRDAVDSLAGAPGVAWVPLVRMGREGVAGMVTDMLALDDEPAAFVEALWRHSEGNPFFVAEYLRASLAGGWLSRNREGMWRVEGGISVADAAAIALPGSLRTLVERRRAGLPAAARELMDAAAVLGREMEAATLLTVAGVGDDDLAPLQELVRHHVLEPLGSRLRFTHDKLREGTYEGLDGERRQRLHAGVAVALASAHQGAEPVAGLARHWELGGDLQKARAGYLAEARAAARRFAPGDAARLYEDHLRLVTMTPEAVEARLELAGARRRLGQPAACEEQLATAVRDATTLDLPEARARGLLRLGRHLKGVPGRRSEARSLVDEALRAFRALARPAGVAETLETLADMEKEEGRREAGLVLDREGLQIARSAGERLLEERFLRGIADAAAHRGEHAEAGELYAEALLIAREQGQRSSEAICLRSLASHHFTGGRYEEAERLFVEATGIAREVGDRPLEVSILANRAVNQRSWGRHKEALAYNEEAFGAARETGNARIEASVLGNIAVLLQREGRSKEALASYERALELSRALGERESEAGWLCNLGAFWQEQGDLERAKQLFRDSLAIAREIRSPSLEGLGLGNLGYVALRSGRYDEAEPLLEQARQLQRRIGAPHLEAHSCENLAEVYGATGRLDDAVRMLRFAREIHAAGRNGQAVAIVLGQLATLDGVAGDVAEGLGKVRQALEGIGDVDVLEKGKLLCRYGHLLLADGQDARDVLSTARELPGDDASELAEHVARLERAQAARDAGSPLVCGTVEGDLPSGFLAWLRSHRPEALPPTGS